MNAVIRMPEVFATLDWSNIALARDGKDVLAKPLGARSEPESERLNRLVVEKAFPGSFREIHTDGWRPTLLIYGVLGVIVGAIFWLIVRNWPSQHPWANEAEKHLIRSGQANAGESSDPNGIPFRQLLSSRNQWLYSATNFFSNVGWVFLITLMPRFLAERFSVPVDERGLMTTIPLFAAAFGLIAGGWFTDRLTLAYGRRWGRAIPMGLFKLPCVIALLSCLALPNAWSVVVAITVMSVFQDFGNPAVWAFAQDTGGKQVGAVLGWGNMWGNLGAGIAPSLMGYLSLQGGWNAVLIAEATAFALCGLFGSLVNANEPLVGRESGAK